MRGVGGAQYPRACGGRARRRVKTPIGHHDCIVENGVDRLLGSYHRNGAIGAVILAIVIANGARAPNLEDVVVVIVLVLIWGVKELRDLQQKVADADARVQSLSARLDVKLPL